MGGQKGCGGYSIVNIAEEIVSSERYAVKIIDIN